MIDEKYTALFAHLGEPSALKVGDKVKYGDFIGEMGNTGTSQGVHLHLAVFEKITTYLPTLAEATPNSDFKPSKEECLLFKNNDLFINEGIKREAIISCGWLGYKNHYAIDYVASGRGFQKYPLIHWNRTYIGTVIGVGYHRNYGNYVLIAYGKNKEIKKEDSHKNEINALNLKIKELEGHNTTLIKNNEKLNYKLTKIKEIMED